MFHESQILHSKVSLPSKHHRVAESSELVQTNYYPKDSKNIRDYKVGLGILRRYTMSSLKP